MAAARRYRTHIVAVAMLRAPEYRLDPSSIARIQSQLVENGYERLPVLVEEFAEVGHVQSYQRRSKRAQELLKVAIISGNFARSGYLVDEYAVDKLRLDPELFEYLVDGNQHFRLDNILERCWVTKNAAKTWLSEALASERLSQGVASAGADQRASPTDFAVEETRSLPVAPVSATADAQAIIDETERRRRGPRAVKREQVHARMRADVEAGRHTLLRLSAMKEKELTADYGVSRDTARKARKLVLSEFAKRANFDK